MKIAVLSLFPDIIEGYCKESVIGRAINDGKLSVKVVNIRDFSENKHKRVDDYPFGGGCGMLIQAEPVFRAYESIKEELSEKHRVFYTSPRGRTLDNSYAKEIATFEDIVIICGHYEGIDQRVLDLIVTDYISIGDFVLTGGELASLVIIDAAARFIDGVLGNESSSHNDSFSDGLLEHPQYTRPAVWRGIEVPEVLLSGHHKKVEEFEHNMSLETTLKYRPDLLNKLELSEGDLNYITRLVNEEDL